MMRHVLAAVLLCALALIGAGVRLFLIEGGGSGERARTLSAADSAVVAGLTRKLAEYTGPVRINTADARALERLPGVERARGGPFGELQDLAARVRGIGPATAAHWEGRITFSDSTSEGEK